MKNLCTPTMVYLVSFNDFIHSDVDMLCSAYFNGQILPGLTHHSFPTYGIC